MFDKVLAALADVLTKEAGRLLGTSDMLLHSDEPYNEIVCNSDTQIQEQAKCLLDHRDRELLGVAAEDAYDALAL